MEDKGMFIVEGRDKSDPVGTYPFKLVFEREVLAGKIFAFLGKNDKKPAAIFYKQEDATKAARKTADELNNKWQGMKEFIFQVIPSPTS